MKKIITQKHWDNIDDKLFRDGMMVFQRRTWMNSKFIVADWMILGFNCLSPCTGRGDIQCF